MAEIPVERKKGGLPWWLIPLILALILIPLIFFLARGCNPAVVGNSNNSNGNSRVASGNGNSARGNNTAVVVNNNSGTMTGNNANANSNAGSVGATMSDANGFGSTADKKTLIGRMADFQNVKVNRVLSDHVFTVKSGDGEMFALLDEKLDTGGGNEKRIQMKPGMSVNLSGDFRAAPNAEVSAEKKEDLNSKEYAQMKGQQIYLHVNNVSAGK